MKKSIMMGHSRDPRQGMPQLMAMLSPPVYIIMLLYIAFIDLTKAFDLVSRDGLCKVLPKIGCPPQLQSMIESFHTDTKGTV